MRLPDEIIFYIGEYLYQDSYFEWLYLNIGIRLMYYLKILKIYDLYGLFRKLYHVSYGSKNKDFLNLIMRRIYNYSNHYSKENFICFDLFSKSNNDDLKNYYLPFIINHNVITSPIQNLSEHIREQILLIYLDEFFTKNVFKSGVACFQINKNINLKYIEPLIQFIKSIKKKDSILFYIYKQDTFDEKLKILELMSSNT
jgi:hypothetical protein